MLTFNNVLAKLGLKQRFYQSQKTHCLLPEHKKDNTPSFQYYQSTDSFYCWGCTRGGEPFQFAYYYLTDLDPNLTYEQVYSLFYEKPEELILDSLLSDLESLKIQEQYDFDSFNYRCSKLIGVFLRSYPNQLDFCERLYVNIDRIVQQQDQQKAESYLESLFPLLSRRRDKVNNTSRV